ncbi:hypothetical protein [Leuconostoc lactis]|uniref:hypothetical protein n=1 Tax=Leuconostoc lactis TaxID=1246 RepID=UPI00020D9D66|nr:hypothetical protein [Leuconostoc lactis]
MKIPIQTPLEQLRDGINTLQHQIQQGIATFRKNILTNRDARHTPKHPQSNTDSRAVSIVSYEATPKAVDADSFAYALTAEMTENQADNLTNLSVSTGIGSCGNTPLASSQYWLLWFCWSIR